MQRLLAISGSLRAGSYNTALLRNLQELAPEGMTVDIFDQMREIPPYDDDVRVAGYPPVVERLREQVKSATALFFSTPEYNRSFSGVLKNAIDWVSRPPDQPLAGKAAIVAGVGPGALGTALANYQLRQVLSVLGVHILPGLEILINHAASKFDGDGRLTDEATRSLVGAHLMQLGQLAQRLS